MKNIHNLDFVLKKWKGAWTNWRILIFTNKWQYYYFSDGIVSLPISHPFLHKINQFKKDKNQKIEDFLLEEKDKLLRMEKNAVAKSQRLSLYRSILQ